MAIFKGAGVALCTPFTQDGINYSELSRLIEFQIENETDALIVCGTTGEPSTMSNIEKQGVIAHAVKQTRHRIPVIAGTGGNNTRKVITDSKIAQDLGADALLLVTPYYNKCTQSGLINHYFEVADEVDIPIIVYNVPARTGLNVAPKTLLKLSEHENIVAVKEASGNISQIVEIARLCENKLDIYSGNDDHIIPVMSVGGIGVISVLSNVVPKQTGELAKSYLSNDLLKARELQFMLNPLVDALFCEVSPIPVKTALNLMGFSMGKLRAPLYEMEENNKMKLISAMKELGLI